MSSSTSEKITTYISDLQEREIITRERLTSIRLFFSRSVGLAVVFYGFSQLLMLFYLLLKYLLWLVFQSFWIPLKTLELFLPQTTNYSILFPLIGCCSLVSYFLPKFSLGKMSRKRQAFWLKCIVLLVFQSLFILLPIAMSIHERRELIATDDSVRLGKLDRLNEYLENSRRTNLSEKVPWSIGKDPAIESEGQSPDAEIKSTKHMSSESVSSIDTAFTDLNCYDYTKSIYRDKQNYLNFLHTYRHRSPFPIYLSIIKSNGPTCRLRSSKTFCANRLSLTSRLYRFARFWLMISIPLIACLMVYKRYQSRSHVDTPQQSIPSKNLPIVQPNIPSRQPLDSTIENKLRLWLTEEAIHGYHNISQSCRLALNRTFCKQYVSNSSRLLKSSKTLMAPHHIYQSSNDLFVY